MILPADGTELGERVRRRLAEEIVVWLVTVDPSGQPRPHPVWFDWVDEGFVVYTSPESRRMANLRANPRVAVHLNADSLGHDLAVFTGTARHVPDAPPADRNERYLRKYREHMKRVFGGPAEFARAHAAALHVRVTRFRGR